METERYNDSSEVMLGMDMCDDNKTWKFYIGYKDMDLPHKLRIERDRQWQKGGNEY